MRQTLRRAGHPHPARDRAAASCRGPSRPSTTASCASCCGEQCDAEFETAKVDGRARRRRRDRSRPTAATLSAPLVVDALGWRRVLGRGDGYQPPDAPLSRGLEVHPGGARRRPRDLDRPPLRARPATAGASRPRDELRIGVGSFDPRFHVKDTDRAAGRGPRRATPVRYQGNWIPHKLRPATEDGVFFAGDSAGHCLPLTAEGIRTAFYFGIALGRELRAVVEGSARPARQHGAAPLRRRCSAPAHGLGSSQCDAARPARMQCPAAAARRAPDCGPRAPAPRSELAAGFARHWVVHGHIPGRSRHSRTLAGDRRRGQAARYAHRRRGPRRRPRRSKAHGRRCDSAEGRRCDARPARSQVDEAASSRDRAAAAQVADHQHGAREQQERRRSRGQA